MRYEKPIVMDLGRRGQLRGLSRPQTATQGLPRSFVRQAPAGSEAATGAETCGTGTGAGWACVPGNSPANSYPSCVGGSDALPDGDCVGGSGVVDWAYCEAGSGGTNDPNGCNVGPSYILG